MSGICIGVKEKCRYFLEEESFDLGCKIKKKSSRERRIKNVQMFIPRTKRVRAVMPFDQFLVTTIQK